MTTKFDELIEDLRRQGWKYRIHRINELETTQRLTESAPALGTLGEVVRWECPSDKKAIFAGLDLTGGSREQADPAYFYFASGADGEAATTDPIAWTKETIFGTEDVGVGHYAEIKEQSDFDKMWRFGETIMLEGGDFIILKILSSYGIEETRNKIMMRCHLFYK